MRAIVLMLLIASLSGCYETEKPVLEKGEKSPFNGVFSCKNGISGKTETIKATEQKSGFWLFANYHYIDQDGETSMFKKLPSGMFLTQQKGKRGTYEYVFLDAVDKNTFIFLVPDMMSKAPYVEALLKKHKVEAAKSGIPRTRLTGDTSALLNFFGAHDKSILSAVMTCQRQ